MEFIKIFIFSMNMSSHEKKETINKFLIKILFII
jgi:hypothetical protein